MTENTEPAWHAIAPDETARRLETDAVRGLSVAMAAERLQRNGPNALHEEQAEPWWEEALESLKEPLQLLLLGVAGVHFWLGERADAVTILVVILVVAGTEVFSELRAKRAVAALSSLSAPLATAIRDGDSAEIAAKTLVPGDLVLLGAGTTVHGHLVSFFRSFRRPLLRSHEMHRGSCDRERAKPGVASR